MEPRELERLYAQASFEKYLDSFFLANSLRDMEALVRRLLGADSFGLGVCVGLVSQPADEFAGLVSLAKTFHLADIYDRVYGKLSWSSFVGSPLAGSAIAVRAALYLVQDSFVVRNTLTNAHRERTQILAEVAAAMADPGTFFEGLPGKLKDRYTAKWQRYSAVKQHADLTSQFKAGQTLGELLMEVLLTIASLVAMGAALGRIATKAPQLLRLAKRFGPRAAPGGRIGPPTIAEPAGEAAAEVRAARPPERAPSSSDSTQPPKQQPSPRAKASPADDGVRQIDDSASPATPVGRRGSRTRFPNPSEPAPRNAPSSIGGRSYSGHALDRMQERGFTPSAVENAIGSGGSEPGAVPGTLQHVDSVNNCNVITDATSGRVITVF
jgi:filamentous hemagglutinin